MPLQLPPLISAKPLKGIPACGSNASCANMAGKKASIGPWHLHRLKTIFWGAKNANLRQNFLPFESSSHAIPGCYKGPIRNRPKSVYKASGKGFI
jgi:hypothetical protein